MSEKRHQVPQLRRSTGFRAVRLGRLARLSPEAFATLATVLWVAGLAVGFFGARAIAA